MPTPTIPSSESSVPGPVYVGLELSAREWRVAYSRGLGQPIRQAVLAAGDAPAWRRLIARAKAQCGLTATAAVRSCYEAGRDQVWPHRWLTREGVLNTVVDSSSIEVNRRARRTKSDRLDARKLVGLLVRATAGDRDVWHAVHVPPPEVEAARQLPRAIAMLTKERTRWRNRIHSLLATVGLRLPIDAQWPTRLASARMWDGGALPEELRLRLELAWRQLQQIEAERRQLCARQWAALRAGATPTARTAQRLLAIRGIGERFAWVLATEICNRALHNRREVGALTGLASAHHRSGKTAHDLGINRTGLAAVRALAVETAWGWVQWQPHSALTQWWTRRFAHGGPAGRAIGIVALARRLVMALWRYSQTGQLPAGAVLKKTAA